MFFSVDELLFFEQFSPSVCGAANFLLSLMIASFSYLKAHTYTHTHMQCCCIDFDRFFVVLCWGLVWGCFGSMEKFWENSDIFFAFVGLRKIYRSFFSFSMNPLESFVQALLKKFFWDLKHTRKTLTPVGAFTWSFLRDKKWHTKHLWNILVSVTIDNHQWKLFSIKILTLEHLKLELARASQLAVVDGQEVKVYEMPTVPMCFVGAMCQFCHRKCPCFGSLESMVVESGRKLHCHRSHGFVASKISSQLNKFFCFRHKQLRKFCFYMFRNEWEK